MSPDEVPDSGRLAGILTRTELQKAGLSDAQIRTLVACGVLTRLSRGVYARSMPESGVGRPGGLGQGVRERANAERADRLLRIAAAVATVGPLAVASHQDAAVVHGLPLLDRPPAGVVSVSRPRGAAASRTGRPGIQVHTIALPTAHVMASNGVPVTTVARTVIDLARTTPFQAGVLVADAALAGAKTSKPELDKVVASCIRWPGIERARSVVQFADRRSESPFESIARVAFRDGGLPPPELQVWVGGDDGPVGRVDFLWRKQRTVAEADGAVKYSDPENARQQLRRDAALREAGFEVVHFSWGELVGSPHQVIAAIKAAFRRAAVLDAAETAGQGGHGQGLGNRSRRRAAVPERR